MLHLVTQLSKVLKIFPWKWKNMWDCWPSQYEMKCLCSYRCKRLKKNPVTYIYFFAKKILFAGCLICGLSTACTGKGNRSR
jgi:hypothetical protein